jgi:tetratricopeptide (TPR) repeat protein
MRASVGRHLISGLVVLSALVFSVAGHFAVSVFAAPADATGGTYQPRSLVGSYLAGRLAGDSNDTTRAARFYGSALLRDPNSKVLLDQAFTMELTNGNFPLALDLAKRLLKVQPKHRMAQLLLGVDAFKARDFEEANMRFKNAALGPIGELTSSLALGWSELQAGNADAALKRLNLENNADWAQYYLTYHRALLSAVAGRDTIANKSFRQVFLRDGRTLRTALAYARHAAHAGKRRQARSIVNKHLASSKGDPHALVRDLLRQLKRGDKIDRLVATPQDGMVEVFYGLGEALAGEGGLTPGMLYLQIALFLDSSHPFALAALASAFETTQRYEKAIETYDRISVDTPLTTAIEIRKALNLNSLDRVGEALQTLQTLLERNQASSVAAKDDATETEDEVSVRLTAGDVLTLGSRLAEVETVQTALQALGYDIGEADGVYGNATRRAVVAFQRASNIDVDGRVGSQTFEALQKASRPLTVSDRRLDKANELLALDAMGNILRARKRYVEAINYYDRAIGLIKRPRPQDWTYFYSRGTCHERSKNWSAAEKDLQQALKLTPDQPLVLNYLGYSWIDQGINLKAGLKLIEKAVALKPDDGYIVDSLGWAHFKLGNVEQAVLFLERAVELRPDDPILNDHLGDALWRAGRQREARFQWEQALTLKPEPDDKAKIQSKLKTGLLAPAPSKTAQKDGVVGAPRTGNGLSN